MIKAIETIYDNYHFRSRLEARWAIFFNTLRVKYEYEKEGFDIDGLWYLPDFYLPDYSCWIEIKPDSFVLGSDEKINAFAKATEDTFLLICGIPKDERYIVNLKSGDLSEYCFFKSCRFVIPRKTTKPELCLLGSGGSWKNLINNPEQTDDEYESLFFRSLDEAYNSAMQARF